jgi:transposase
MRGDDDLQEGIFSYISPEKRVPADHPLRPIRKMVDEILKEMSPKFAKLYSKVGRPSIAPERLLRSLLLQVFYSVRSERMLIEQLQYNMLFRWFVGMEMDEVVWNHAVYSKNRERLLNEEIAESFFQRVLERAKPYMSDEHFTVDGTLIEAWASHKSFRPKDGSGKPPGAGGSDAHGRSDPCGKARDIGRRQELRHAGIRPRTAWDEHHPACGAEHDQSEECGGRADHTARRV